MIFRVFSYLKFLLKSTNQHGVHSPFVYNFVTKGLYKKNDSNVNFSNLDIPNYLTKKEEKVLKKIINYFKITSVISNTEIKSKTLDGSFNLLYFNNLEIFNVDIFSKNYPNSVIVLKNIYGDKKSKNNWVKIINLKEATVTIDLFYFGLIFFRKGQRKEHFKIRV